MLNVCCRYGAPAEDVFNYECAVLVATGIGVTPWASTLKELIARHRSHTLRPLRRVVFVWLNRDASGFEWFASMVSIVPDLINCSLIHLIACYLAARPRSANR